MKDWQQKVQKLIHLPWFPFLIAVWFMFFPYAHNKNDLTLNAVVTPIEFGLLISVVLYILCFLIYRSYKRAALLATSLVVFILGYGYIADFINRPHISRLSTGGFLLPILLLIAVYIGFRTWKLKEDSDKVNKISLALNIAGFFLIMINLLPAMLSSDRNISSDTATTSKASDLSKSKVNLSKAPDIYYIVPEDYAGNPTLSQYFNYDNSAYTNFLKSKGFSVSDKAVPNYPFSPPSLSSTLNMRYLGPESKKYSGKTSSAVPYYNLISNNQVVQDLKSVGYEYVHIGSWWGPTQTNPLADVQFSTPTKLTVLGHTYSPSEFEQSLVQASIGRLLLSHPLTLGKKVVFKSQSTQLTNKAQTFFNQFSYLKQIVKNVQSPKFVFMHIMAPHRPFVINKNCQATPERYGNSVSFFANQYTKDYVDELQCVNSQLENAVSYIQANSPRPPVIIIQSDEGEYPLAYWEGQVDDDAYNWYSAPTSMLNYKFLSQAAFYLPGVDKVDVKQDEYVNIFRFVFNKYLGANLPLLPQKYYISNENSTPYTFQDVTSKISH